MEDWKTKPLKYKELPGLTERQLSEHHDVLYAGYVKKINEIRQKLGSADKTGANATFSDIRELKVEETFAMNGVVLHEGYFDNMGGKGVSSASGAVKEWIERDFGSFESWRQEFEAMGIAARGWVVLAFDMNDGRLHNYLCDVHNQGGVWNCIALLILDVYEHAYFLDYGTQRKKYIEAFMNTIDWEHVNGLVHKFNLARWKS